MNTISFCVFYIRVGLHIQSIVGLIKYFCVFQNSRTRTFLSTSYISKDSSECHVYCNDTRKITFVYASNINTLSTMEYLIK